MGIAICLDMFARSPWNRTERNGGCMAVKLVPKTVEVARADFKHQNQHPIDMVPGAEQQLATIIGDN